MHKCDSRHYRGIHPLAAYQSVISLKDKTWFVHTYILYLLFLGKPSFINYAREISKYFDTVIEISNSKIRNHYPYLNHSHYVYRYT